MANASPLGRVGVVGLGVSTQGVLRYLFGIGVREVTLRLRTEVPVPDTLPPFEQVRVLSGHKQLDYIDEDTLFLSPSVRPDLPPLREARARGVHMESDVGYFLSHTTGTVLAITGSDGKSTTTKITELLLHTGAFDSVRIGGNFGHALCHGLLTEAGRVAYAVELSSFQLMLPIPRVRRALLTNISENHLDWHRDMDEYVAAKGRLFAAAEDCVLNADDHRCVALLGKTPFAVYSTRMPHAQLRPFGAEVIGTVEDGALCLNGVPTVPLTDIALHGAHNVQNLLAALCLAYGYTDAPTAVRVARTFRGLPHRATEVGTVGGVRYVDASIDTTPSRTAATLASLKDPTVVLLCGRSKGCEIGTLCDALTWHARAVVLAGEFGQEIFEALRTHLSVPLILCATMREAVHAAAGLARAGDTVLLSPGATSFDEYTSYEERGEDFRRTVLALSGGTDV